MLKQMFEDYADNVLAIERLKADDCLVSDVVRGSHTEPPYGQHSIRVLGVDRARKLRNQRMIAELERQVQTVDEVIKRAPNSQMRQILMLRYQDRLEWDDVGAALQKSGDACRKKAERWLTGG